MNPFQEIFNKQKAYFDSDATKSYEWRIDQLTRLENLCNENSEALEAAMSSDFKTASQEKVFEIMAPVGTAAFAKARVERVDEARRCRRSQGSSGERTYCQGLSRALWRHAGDRSFQRAIDAAFRSCVSRSLRQAIHASSNSPRVCSPRASSSWISFRNTSILGPSLPSREAKKKLRSFSSCRLTSSFSPAA